MEIYLDGIGLIKDSTIKLEGLTVITGENNSGKSTVGKALYAIADGMIDIDIKQERDELDYCSRVLKGELRSLIQTMYRFNDTEFDNMFIDYHEKNNNTPAMMEILVGKRFTSLLLNGDFISFIEKLEHEISNFKFNDKKIQNDMFDKRPFSPLMIKRKSNAQYSIERAEEARSNALELCSKIKKTMLHGIETTRFIRTYMNYTLRSEFNKEVQPVKVKEASSKIIFRDEQGILFQCKIKDNHILSENFESILYVFYNAFFIDNAFILDEVSTKTNRFHYRSTRYSEEEIVDKTKILTHTEKLIEYLNTQAEPNITYELENEKKYSIIKEKIVSILPGDFKSSSDGLKYVHDGVSLKAINLATGSKMFAIIKMILDRYGFDDRTMLILDEPEAHLHPKWQNMFAEVIVLLVKELGVRVLLTSHSTHFVLALDAHMRKHEIIEKTNFYQTDIIEDGFVQYKLVNDDLTAIYDDFAAYFAESKYMRDQFLYGDDQ